MTRLALLLRGINVGGNNKIAMIDLKAVLADLDYTAITTLLNSGNAVVSTTDAPENAERRVSKAISDVLGLKIETMARTHDELAAVVKANPFKRLATNPSHYAVAFLRSTPKADALDHLDADSYAPECWKLIGRELFIWYANGQARTKIGAAFFEKQVKVAATARNWNTVEKLLALTA